MFKYLIFIFTHNFCILCVKLSVVVLVVSFILWILTITYNIKICINVFIEVGYKNQIFFFNDIAEGTHIYVYKVKIFFIIINIYKKFVNLIEGSPKATNTTDPALVMNQPSDIEFYGYGKVRLLCNFIE